MFGEIVDLIFHYLININQNKANKLQTLSLIFVRASLSINLFIIFCLHFLNLNIFGPLIAVDKINHSHNYLRNIGLDLIINCQQSFIASKQLAMDLRYLLAIEIDKDNLNNYTRELLDSICLAFIFDKLGIFKFNSFDKMAIKYIYLKVINLMELI